jgi:hypothetical protein
MFMGERPASALSDISIHIQVPYNWGSEEVQLFMLVVSNL